MFPFSSASTEACSNGANEGRCDDVCGIGALGDEDAGARRIWRVSWIKVRGCWVVRMRERRVE